MTKLFKNSKSVLSIALAFAVLAVSLFTGVVINTEAACASSEGTISVLAYNYNEPEDGDRYFDSNLADNGETGDSWETAIIIDSGLELSYLARKAGDATKGKYYKVADGIKGFDMSGGKITDFASTLAENLEAVSTSGKRHEGEASSPFQGNFDGNGAIVYGLMSTDAPQGAGLFPYAKGNVTIKNVGVSLSSLKAKLHAGGIVGAYNFDNVIGANDGNQLTIQNCSVTDCYIEITESGNGGFASAPSAIGAIYGAARCYSGSWNGKVTVSNCFINLDEDYFISPGETQAVLSVHGGIGGAAVTQGSTFDNCVVIGIAPYSVLNTGYTADNNHQHTNDPARFNNIYTTAATGTVTVGGVLGTRTYKTNQVAQLTAEQMQSDAAIANMNLDWSVWLANPNGYPEFSVAHKDATPTDNHDGTHSIACACGVYGAPTGHSFVDGVCECGALDNCANKKTIYWNGGTDSTLADNGETGADADNAIIIDSAEELAYLVKDASIRDYSTGVEGGVATVADKYYKIADGIGAIVLQPKAYAEDIMGLNGAAEVENYFSDTSKSFKTWAGCEGWEQGSFAGTFDGNGVTIYGMYGNDSNLGNSGLFSTVDAGATFKNFTIKNAYLHTSKANFNVGAIACVSSEAQYDHGVGVIWVDRCAVVNSYIRNDCEDYKRSGIMLGNLGNSEAAYFDNCLVYGNDAAYGPNDTPMAILGSAKNSIKPEEAINIPEGLETVLASDNLYRSMVRNSIIIGATPYIVATDVYRVNDKDSFVNVYTDAETQDVVRGDNKSTVTYEENQIKKLSATDGATIAAEAENLDWNNVWFAADIPAFRDAHDDELSVEWAEDNYAGHVTACSCGLATTVEKHTYTVTGEGMDAIYQCSVCDFTCDHENNEHVTWTPVDGDCLTATAMHGECDCGFSADIPAGSAPGHDFDDVVEEIPSTCQSQGTAAYNYCPNCDKKYAADADNMAAFDTALSDEELKLALGEHTHAVTPDNVPVYLPTDAGHQRVCDVCSQPYGDVEAHQGDAVADGANGHAVTCTVAGCGYAEESAPHVFGDDNVCDTCNWTCESHTWVDDGEPVFAMEITDDVCKIQAQKCDICGIAGENKPVDHQLSDWQTNPRAPFTPACAGEGSHTEIRSCTECWYNGGMMPSEKFSKTVTDPKTGHAFDEVEASDANCLYEGEIAHKYCPNCSYSFAMDAADDEAYENALTDEELYTPVDPEAHVWVEYEAKDADCENDGYTEDHKFCSVCYTFVIGEEATDIVVDFEEFYKYEYENEDDWVGTPVGYGAIADAYAAELYDEMFAQYLADLGVVLPEEPAEDADWEEWNAYYEEYYTIMNGVDTTAFEKEWNPILKEIFNEAYHQYFLEAAAADEENPVKLVIPATGHTIVKVDEVAATYEKEGTKAHYACASCGTLYADAEGTIVVTEEELVIAKLVKEEENKPSTDDKEDDKTEGDKSDKSPATGESVAAVAAVAALMGAAFVLVRKARKA